MALLAGTAGVNGLANELYGALNGAFPLGSQPAVDTDRKAWCDVLAATIIAHIQTNAVVTTTLAVTNVSGVTVGGGVSGPGTGTGTGTVA